MPSCAEAEAASRSPSLKADRTPRTNSGGRRWMSCFFHPPKMPRKRRKPGEKNAEAGACRLSVGLRYAPASSEAARSHFCPRSSHSGFVPSPFRFCSGPDTHVTHRRRLGLVAGCVAPALLMLVVMSAGTTMLGMMQRQSPEAVTRRDALIVHSLIAERKLPTSSDPEVRVT